MGSLGSDRATGVFKSALSEHPPGSIFNSSLHVCLWRFWGGGGRGTLALKATSRLGLCFCGTLVRVLFRLLAVKWHHQVAQDSPASDHPRCLSQEFWVKRHRGYIQEVRQACRSSSRWTPSALATVQRCSGRARVSEALPVGRQRGHIAQGPATPLSTCGSGWSFPHASDKFSVCGSEIRA